MNSRYICLWLTIICVSFSTCSGRTIFEKTIISLLRPVRQVQTDENIKLGDENNNSFADSFSKNYSDKEILCLTQKKILVSGNCYELSKTGPCGNDEWLILDKSTQEGENLKAICKKKPCTEINKVWWPVLSMCISKSQAKKEYCNETTKVIQINSFGEGICTCHENFGKIKGDDKCYEYYQQGPCEQDEVVTYDIKTENAVCSLDKCLKKNQESFSDRSISQQDFHRVSGYKDINESLPQNVEEDELFDSEQQISKNNFKQIAELKGKSYAPLNGDGECYKLGSSSICSEYGDQSRFVVDQNIHVPKCSTTNLQLHIIGGTNNCNLDHNGQCKKSVVVMKNQNKYVYS